MKILMINGSPHPRGCTYTALHEMERVLRAAGAEVQILTVGAEQMGGCVACALLFSKVLIPALGIPDETASGIYSVCFQQSARVLRDHGDTVTPEEYAEIDRVLDAEKLPELTSDDLTAAPGVGQSTAQVVHNVDELAGRQ